MIKLGWSRSHNATFYFLYPNGTQTVFKVYWIGQKSHFDHTIFYFNIVFVRYFVRFLVEHFFSI